MLELSIFCNGENHAVTGCVKCKTQLNIIIIKNIFYNKLNIHKKKNVKDKIFLSILLYVEICTIHY